MRRPLAATVVAALALAGCAHRADVAPPASAPNVPLAVAVAGTLVERVTLNGRVGPPAGATSRLAFAEAGIVARIEVRVGERVAAGTVLAELDRAALAAPLEAARADQENADAGYAGGAVATAAVRSAAAKVAAARERLAMLERGGPSALGGRIEAQALARQAALKVAADEAELTRERTLFAAGVAAKKEVDAARVALASDLADRQAADAKVALASSDVASSLAQARADAAAAASDEAAARSQAGVLAATAAAARARVDAAEIAYANGILRAPADGVVVAIMKHVGEAADPSTPVVETGPVATREATLTAGADVAQQLSAGDPLTLHLTGAGVDAPGRIVAVVPVVDPATHVATVVVDGVPANAAPGDSIEATIAVARVAGIIVPASAIVEDPETGKTVVFVRVPGNQDPDAAFTMREVRVRASDETHAAIGAGLRAGERVAARGGYTLLAPMGD